MKRPLAAVAALALAAGLIATPAYAVEPTTVTANVFPDRVAATTETGIFDGIQVSGAVNCAATPPESSPDGPVVGETVRLEYRLKGDSWRDSGQRPVISTMQEYNANVDDFKRADPGYVDFRVIFAGNSLCASDVSNTARLTIVPPLTAPRDLSVARKSTTSVSVLWDPPKSTYGSPLLGYQGQRSGSSSVKQIDADDSSYTFTGLRPSTTYTLRVRAQTEEQVGAWAQVRVTTKAIARKAYRNCTALNKVYPHGVGKTTARDKTSGKRVTNFFKDNTLYAMNDGRVVSKGQYDLDRDNDGIACEKR